METGNETGKTLDEHSKYLKNNLINAAKHTWKRQTWWWNDKVQQAVSYKPNVAKYEKQEETEVLIRLLNVHPAFLCTRPKLMLRRLRSNISIPDLLRYIDLLSKWEKHLCNVCQTGVG